MPVRIIALIHMLLLSSGCANHLFFHPDSRIWDEPEGHGLIKEDVQITSEDGIRLHAWWFPSPQHPAKGTVIHFHGNAGNVSAHFHGSRWLMREGYQVLLFDYRGYGKSEGSPSRSGIVRDSVAAIAYARSRDDVDPAKLILLGQSLGGMAALNAAALTPEPAAAIVIDCAFSTHRRIAAEKLKPLSFGWLIRPFLPLFISSSFDPLHALSKISNSPILFVHGEQDRVVPPHHSQILHEASAGSTLYLIPDGRHTDSSNRPASRARILQFIEDCLQEK